MTGNTDKLMRVSLWETVLLAIVAAAILGTVGYHALKHGSGEANMHVHQAEAFLAGRLNVPAEIGGDISCHDGRYYVPFPPFPAALLVPFVAIIGPTRTNTVLIAVALTIWSLWFMVRILRSFGLSVRETCYAAMAFYLGTGYWSAVMIAHGVHYFAQVVAVTAFVGAVAECLYKRRPLVVMLFWGAAFLSRQSMVFTWVFLAGLLAVGQDLSPRRRLTRILLFVMVSAIPVGIYLLYNYVRFDNPFDTGYSRIVLPDGFGKERMAMYGIFSWHYIPVNFLHLFLQGFSFTFSGPMQMSAPTPDPFGTSLTFASPFLFFAFYAKWNRTYLVTAWLSVSLILMTVLTYYVNGWVQINAQRYALDFIPIVFLLFARAIPSIPRALWIGAVVYSVALNVIALFLFPFLKRML
jgi:hypothetical protein